VHQLYYFIPVERRMKWKQAISLLDINGITYPIYLQSLNLSFIYLYKKGNEMTPQGIWSKCSSSLLCSTSPFSASLLLSISFLLFSLLCQNEGEFYEYKFSHFISYYELIFWSFLFSYNIFTKSLKRLNLFLTLNWIKGFEKPDQFKNLFVNQLILIFWKYFIYYLDFVCDFLFGIFQIIS
jgi:hypothetical protein